MSVSASTLDLLTLLRLAGVGPRGAIRLAEGDLSQRRAQPEWEVARASAEGTVALSEAQGIEITGWFDSGYPSRLRVIPQPPAVLYLLGSREAAFSDRSVAIVGTRQPDEHGRATTQRITAAFAKAGWVIVSGLALGVDTLAHREALAAGAPTIAVLGNGLDSVYPAANRGLADQILEQGGLLAAEVPPGARVSRHQLVARDRLQSGLSDLTIVCQAGRESGAMHTARFAIEQGRRLLVPVVGLGTTSEEDSGVAALQHLPVSRLRTQLPAWKRVRTTVAVSDQPPAERLTPELLAELVRMPEPAGHAEQQARLFEP